MDNLMYRIWKSPWTQLALFLWFELGAWPIQKFGFWSIVCLIAAAISLNRFLTLGKIRWGDPFKRAHE